MSTPPEQPLIPPAGPTSPFGGQPGSVPPPPQQQWAPQAPPEQQWPGHAPYAAPGWAAPAPEPESARAVRTARTALGWSIAAGVAAGLALVVAAVAAVASIGGGPDDDFFYETMRGQVVGLPTGGALSGDRLEHVIEGQLDEFAVGHDIECPDTEAVSVSTVVVCRGEVDDYEWTGVVVFEDDSGSFAVVEL